MTELAITLPLDVVKSLLERAEYATEEEFAVNRLVADEIEAVEKLARGNDFPDRGELAATAPKNAS
jgi:hypothetical protein